MKKSRTVSQTHPQRQPANALRNAHCRHRVPRSDSRLPEAITLPHRPAHPSQPEGHSPPMANNRFLPLPPGQRPRLDPHRDQASVIAVSPPKPPARCSPVGHRPNRSKRPAGRAPTADGLLDYTPPDADRNLQPPNSHPPKRRFLHWPRKGLTVLTAFLMDSVAFSSTARLPRHHKTVQFHKTRSSSNNRQYSALIIKLI